jgi:GntR family transcriptional regulator
VTTVLDHDISTPLYLQLKQHLLNKIACGEWKEGERIPTELELKKEFGVSRATIRQALVEIEREGIIERRRGVGSIVYHQRIKPELMKLTSFTEDMTSRGFTPGSRVINVDYVVPPGRACTMLGIAPGEKVWWIKRLRLADNSPLGVHDLYIPPDLKFAPRDLAGMDSFYRLLVEQHKLKPAYATETLTAAGATKTEAALLHIPEGAPLLIIWRRTCSEDERVLEVVRLAYIAERYEYHAQLYV